MDHALESSAVATTLLDSSPDGLLVVDEKGVIVVANKAADLIFGYASGELIGVRIEELVPEERRGRHQALREGYLSEPVRRPMGTDLRLFGQHRDGSLFPVEVSLSPVDLDEDSCTIASVRDVSERQETMARLALLRDRERIARDIHDMVIQRLFAAGMSLQAVTNLIEPATARTRVEAVTEELDETIRQLRAAIFHLGQSGHSSLRAHVAEVIGERSQHLGFVPEIDVTGDLDGVPEYIGEQLIATITEALSNVARHAAASNVQISIAVDGAEVNLVVTDDGVGVPDVPNPRGGLSNMMWRAAELGGSCTVSRNEPSGTELSWTVPTESPKR